MCKKNCNFATAKLKIENKMDEKTKSRILEIANGATIEDADKSAIKEAAKELGIKIKNTRCKSCLIDAAILCALEIRKDGSPEKEPEKEPQKATEQTPEKPKRYKLKDGINITFNFSAVNNRTCNTPEKCEKMIRKGVPLKYFEICE
jgi:hypothetical protein